MSTSGWSSGSGARFRESPSRPTSSWASRARPRRTSRPRAGRWTGSDTRAPSSSSTRPVRARARPNGRRRWTRRRRRAASRCSSRSRRNDRFSRTNRTSDPSSRCWSRARRSGTLPSGSGSPRSSRRPCSRTAGRETVTYRSGADSALHSIYLHAYPNAFRDPRTVFAREGERWGEDYAVRLASPRERGWMTLDSVTADGTPAALFLDETVARVDLPRPLAPGGSVTVGLRFEVQVPRPIARFGHVGTDYSMGQWYPKVAVYDELGWHPDPYHYFAEFYGDYATFDVSITLPDPFWVGATGVMQSASGGDNEIPLADREAPRDSVTVRLRVVTADSLRDRWPRRRLSLSTDLE